MWEYTVKPLAISSDSFHRYHDTKFLNELGKEGWELVSVISDCNSSSQGLFFFKRKLETIKL